MNFPAILIYPLADGAPALHLVQTDQGRKMLPKTLSAKNEDELERLQKIGWKVKE